MVVQPVLRGRAGSAGGGQCGPQPSAGRRLPPRVEMEVEDGYQGLDNSALITRCCGRAGHTPTTCADTRSTPPGLLAAPLLQATTSPAASVWAPTAPPPPPSAAASPPLPPTQAPPRSRLHTHHAQQKEFTWQPPQPSRSVSQAFTNPTLISQPAIPPPLVTPSPALPCCVPTSPPSPTPPQYPTPHCFTSGLVQS